jgi:hypothetical protein
MVMLGSHYPISSFPSQEMDKEFMKKTLNVDHFFNEENLDTHEMNSYSPMDNLKLIPLDSNCFVVTNSPCLTEIDKECFPTIGGSCIGTSCSKDFCDLIPSSNHEYVLEDILDSHMV